jgi:hypothetical protein
VAPGRHYRHTLLEAALDESTARVGEVVVAALADELAIAAHRLDPGLLQTILQRQAHEELGHE